MATWSKYTLTETGEKLIALAIAGAKELEITTVKISSCDYSETDLNQLTELKDVKQSFTPETIAIANDSNVRIEVTITNVGLSESYTMNTIGIYATGDNQEEALIAVATAIDSDTMNPIENGTVKNIILKIYIAIDSTEAVTILVNLDTYVTRGNCIDVAHPVRSIYMAIGGDDPATLFGGTWQKIEGRYIRASGVVSATYKLSSGQTGGEEAHKITTAEMPAHGHTRGTQNITGSVWADDSVYNSWYGKLEGAFYKGKYVGNGDHDSHGGGYQSGQIAFEASRSWTGTSSIEGKSVAMPLQPIFIALDVWLRVA